MKRILYILITISLSSCISSKWTRISTDGLQGIVVYRDSVGMCLYTYNGTPIDSIEMQIINSCDVISATSSAKKIKKL